jgi:DNA-directed RNA polymerase specialized sigma24 family protein
VSNEQSPGFIAWPGNWCACLVRQLVRNRAEADDVVAETFAKILDLLRRGGGPDDAFRPYRWRASAGRCSAWVSRERKATSVAPATPVRFPSSDVAKQTTWMPLPGCWSDMNAASIS